MLHLSTALAAKVLYQMQTESGGNPNAINLSDINAQNGDPSRGLMQVIMATFDAFHVAGTSWNIYDPLANIAAAINYGEHRYGPTLESNGMGIGSGHGYWAGGFMPPGRWGYVGERGTEVAKARPGGGVDIIPMQGGSNREITVNQNYYGTQFPTPDMLAHQKIDLALALGVAP
jgi:SLT domain-containing protein